MKPSPITDITILTPLEVAAWLKVKPREVKRLGVPCIEFQPTDVIEKGETKKRLHTKTVRYFRADVLAWLQQQRRAS